MSSQEAYQLHLPHLLYWNFAGLTCPIFTNKIKIVLICIQHRQNAISLSLCVVRFFYLDVNIKYTFPKAVKWSITGENNLCKVELNSVVPIHETESIICQREGRSACCCVQFWIKPRDIWECWTIGYNVDIWINIIVQEVPSAADCPALTHVKHRSSSLFCVIFILLTKDICFLTTTINVQWVMTCFEFWKFRKKYLERVIFTNILWINTWS